MDILFIFKEHPIYIYMRTVKALTSFKLGIMYKQQYTPILKLQVKSKKGYLGPDIFVEAFSWTLRAPSVYICLRVKALYRLFFQSEYVWLSEYVLHV